MACDSPSAFVNKVLLEYSYVHLVMYCLRLLLNFNSRVVVTDYMACKVKMFTF